MEKCKDMRISPISHQDWTPDVRDILRIFSQQLANLGIGGDESEKDTLSRVLSCLLRNPNLARSFLPFGRYLLMDSSLDSRCRELVILRVTWLWRFEYEWAHHSMTAVGNGLLSEAEIEMLQRDDMADCWSAGESCLLQAVNDLHEHSNIEDATWNSLINYFSTEELLDIVFTVGGYVVSGLYMNVIGFPLKEGMQGFTS